MSEKYDVFICYRGHVDEGASGTLARLIYDSLKNRYHVFLASDESCVSIGSDFKKVEEEVLSHVKLVLMCLSNHFFDDCPKSDDMVMFELRKIYARRESIAVLPILLPNFRMRAIPQNVLPDEIYDMLVHMKGLSYKGVYDNVSFIRELDEKVGKNLDAGMAQLSVQAGGRYYGATEECESLFLQNQFMLLREYDMDVLCKMAPAAKAFKCALDIGCNTGSMAHEYFKRILNIPCVLGIDNDEMAIKKAQSSHPDICFLRQDVDDDSCGKDLRKWCDQHGQSGFDIIGISMVLLHVARPGRVLRMLKSVLNPSGMVFIRDIDDGVNIIHPDENGGFSRMMAICKYCDILGRRNCGRMIFSWLKDAGFHDVKLCKVGLNTSELDDEKKELLFDMYFGYVPVALRKTIEQFGKHHPGMELPRKVLVDRAWVNDEIGSLKDAFMKDGTLFSLGYMIYTAKK